VQHFDPGQRDVANFAVGLVQPIGRLVLADNCAGCGGEPDRWAACVALAERGVLVLPDFIANAGGVICAAIEYEGGSEAVALAAIDEKVRSNTRAVLDRVSSNRILPRAAAVELARVRIKRAMRTRRWGTDLSSN
jgi:glutamate dehydrogenase/leucine dehydrogenase